METNLFTKLDAAVKQQKLTVIRDADTFTTKEFGDSTGISRSAALARLSLLEKQNIIARTRVQQLQNNNRIQVVDGWKYLGNSAETGQVGSGISGNRTGTGRRGKQKGKETLVKSPPASRC